MEITEPKIQNDKVEKFSTGDNMQMFYVPIRATPASIGTLNTGDSIITEDNRVATIVSTNVKELNVIGVNHPIIIHYVYTGVSKAKKNQRVQSFTSFFDKVYFVW